MSADHQEEVLVEEEIYFLLQLKGEEDDRMRVKGWEGSRVIVEEEGKEARRGGGEGERKGDRWERRREMRSRRRRTGRM